MVEVKDVKAFWEDKGMTYGTDHGGLVYHRDGRDITVEKGSPEFFRLVDEVFFNWNQYLHNESGRFGAIFPYERFRGKRVL